MEQRSLDAYKKALEDGKMICGRVLVLPDCMAIMARELWREERVLLLDVNQGSVGFYVLSGRHCLACRMTGLKAGCFLREGAVDMLCEEMAEQVEGLIEDCAAASDVSFPDCMVLMTSCIPDAEAAAEYMSQRFKIPCYVRMPEPVEAVCLAICVAGPCSCLPTHWRQRDCPFTRPIWTMQQERRFPGQSMPWKEQSIRTVSVNPWRWKKE